MQLLSHATTEMNPPAGAGWSVTEAAPGKTTNGAPSAIRRRTEAERADLSISREHAAKLGGAISVALTTFFSSHVLEEMDAAYGGA